MRLKKLELFGFKSFADKTQITFDQGVTCVVGPNGCGKSNISDAIRWVLGERSPKMLRGSKMEDVIFNGTDFRKPIALAEVTLTIDNADRGLPIDYQEVSLTRRLYRSGESEYLINKTACRLKDIQDLILDTGLGSSMYSMIEQGRIDYILNAEPEERRFLIEEAAGIAKYKVKKDEAIRKLERTEENRLRLNDIVHEVQKNIQYAERQARRAQRFREFFEELKDLEIRKAFHDLQKLEGAEQELTALEAGHQSRQAEWETRLSALRSEQQKLDETLASILDRYSAEESQKHRTVSKFEQNEQTLAFHQEKRMSMAGRRGQIEQETAQLEDRIQKSRWEIQAKQKEIAALEQQKSESSNTLEQAQEEMKAVEAQITQGKTRFDEGKREAFQTAAESVKNRNEYHRVAAFLETNTQHRERQQAALERLQKEAGQYSAKTQLYDQDAGRRLQTLEALQQEKNAARQAMEQINAGLQDCRTSLQELDRKIHEDETRLNWLLEMSKQHEGVEQSVLEAIHPETQPLVETLRGVLTVEKGYEWALEAALESFSKTLISHDLPTAEQLLECLREKKSAGLGILIKNLEVPEGESSANSTSPEHPYIQCRLEEVVRVKEGYEKALRSFFQDVFIITPSANGDTLRALLPFAWRNRLLLSDGTVLGPHGRVYFRKEDLASQESPFQRNAEIEQLKQAVDSGRALREEEQGKSLELQERFAECRQNIERLEAKNLETALQKESFDSYQKGVQDRLASMEREIELLRFEIETLKAQEEKALQDQQAGEANVREAEAAEKKVRLLQENLLQELEKMEQEKNQIFKTLTERRSQSAHLEERIQLLSDAARLLEEHSVQDETRIQILRDESATILHLEKDLDRKDGEIRKEQGLLQEERNKSEVALELIRREKEAAERELASLRKAFEEIQTEIQHIQTELHQLQMKRMDLGYQRKTIAERLAQTYKVQLGDYPAENYPVLESIESLEERVRGLREKVDSIGTVNLLAIEEYEELKQRYEFLETQIKDLETAKESLLETIRQINRTTKTLFHDTFQEVQRTFQEYYQTLFQGGNAQLVLLDETNPLESGIDIVVRPPGKKLQNIRLLSGGEKALTAAALLFALFKIKPSPFCVLDEVDAPLDEANVDRFLSVLRTFLQTTQFIIVTHNRKTIAMGDILYGVTMEEAGISKLVSVKIGQEVNSVLDKEAAEEKVST